MQDERLRLDMIDRAIEMYSVSQKRNPEFRPSKIKIAKLVCSEFNVPYTNKYRLKLTRALLKHERKATPAGIEKAAKDIDVDARAMPFLWIKTKDVSAFIRNPNYKAEEINFDEIVEQCMEEYKPLPKNYSPVTPLLGETFDTLTFTDTHVGMDASRKGLALYPTEWDGTVLMDRIREMADYTLTKKTSRHLIIRDLGDFMDGYNQETTRGGHKLPQNMTNEEAFDTGLQAKLLLIQQLAPHYGRIEVHNVNNDNHSAAWGYVVNSALKRIVDVLYDNVFVHNHKKFISVYYVGRHAFLISHGKDYQFMKNGFPVKPDHKAMERIDQFCKHNNVYKKADFVTFCKGDSHQALFDQCSSDDFDYFSYPALSPSSEWVQMNFKKGRTGFVFESTDYATGNRSISPYFFSSEKTEDHVKSE